MGQQIHFKSYSLLDANCGLEVTNAFPEDDPDKNSVALNILIRFPDGEMFICSGAINDQGRLDIWSDFNTWGTNYQILEPLLHKYQRIEYTIS